MSEVTEMLEKYRDTALKDWKGQECYGYLECMFEMILNDIALNSGKEMEK
jgi:hypothetical protein